MKKGEGLKGSEQYRDNFVFRKAYHLWDTVKARCINPNVKCYSYYGGRGIELKISRKKFVDWYIQEAKGRTDLTVDRIDNDGHYELGNMQLITKAENSRKECRETDVGLQAMLKKTRKPVRVGGVVFASFSDASRFLGKHVNYVSDHLKKGVLPNGMAVKSVSRNHIGDDVKVSG